MTRANMPAMSSIPNKTNSIFIPIGVGFLSSFQSLIGMNASPSSGPILLPSLPLPYRS